MSLVRTDLAPQESGIRPRAPPGYGPSDLHSAYNLPNSTGAGRTVAIVDAYDDPNAESDLATYRSQFGLPPCTTANGCFRKVNQNGQSSPLPSGNIGWGIETSLDLDMVSAICPDCHILLVEANSSSNSGLYTAEDTAAGMATYVSNSWGGGEYAGEASDDSHFDHPGTVITASSGDTGAQIIYPSSSQYVTAVGGTSLNRSSNARDWSESPWSGAGYGCSPYESKPSWQNVDTGCSGRATADVSAVADPSTGLAVYDTYGRSGWTVAAGTSAASPIIAATYALAGVPGSDDYPAAYPYANPGALNDVSPTGWDGPSGLGIPNGTGAFTG